MKFVALIYLVGGAGLYLFFLHLRAVDSVELDTRTAEYMADVKAQADGNLLKEVQLLAVYLLLWPLAIFAALYFYLKDRSN